MPLIEDKLHVALGFVLILHAILFWIALEVKVFWFESCVGTDRNPIVC